MKCLYCGQETNKKEYCSKECQHDIEHFNQYKRKYMPVFAIIALVAVIIALAWQSPLRNPICLIVLGLDFIIFPFTKASTINRKGVKKSIKTARMIGGFALIVGLVALILMLI